jgi:hypothetical protein
VLLTATSSRQVPNRFGLDAWITEIGRSLPSQLR